MKSEIKNEATTGRTTAQDFGSRIGPQETRRLLVTPRPVPSVIVSLMRRALAL